MTEKEKLAKLKQILSVLNGVAPSGNYGKPTAKKYTRQLFRIDEAYVACAALIEELEKKGTTAL